MSAEFDAARNIVRKEVVMQKTLRNDSSNDDDDNLEDLAGSANNSIIGKVKSRVSSIIPSSLSKWFSPSTRNNEQLNGSFSVGTARRRRRLEIEDDEYVDDDGDANEDRVLAQSEYKENMSRRNIQKDTDEDNTDNSEDDLPKEAGETMQRTKYTTRTFGSATQPPTKRSRISFDIEGVHQPLVASTPAIGISIRNVTTHSSSMEDKMSKPSTSHSLRHYSDTNSGNQKQVDQPTSYTYPSSVATDIKAQESFVVRPNSKEKCVDNISSRRTLHLRPTSQDTKEELMGISNLKRQSLSDIRDIKKHNIESPSINSTTTMMADEEETQLNHHNQSDTKARRNLNGNTLLFDGNKKQRLNNSEEADESNADADSASESSECFIANVSELPTQRKTGLFNMSSLNCQNGNNSRTSSFGNGINFYSHLEGRKSLFSGVAHTGEPAKALNNSTLSLTSLNRRQFNASIYGSTSALSDSRLLNTFSPFYKGKTTYGGAAAYKKYSSASGANRVSNITPTIIRPTSSLSTLSSSNNSLAATTGGTNQLCGLGNSGTENISAISSTAKRILDLINDFATPLSEAKKMANTNVKVNTNALPQTKSRLNESDLQTSRAIRLCQVRTPYTRPAVTLQPTTRTPTLLPPIKELQVPSMSQLLQMKKMQTTTERSRQITMQNSGSTTRSIVGKGEYILPIADDNNENDKEYSQSRQQQQQHTNKIKSKGRTSARITASKNVNNLADDELPPAVNLPNIAFPLMQSVPTFDIALPKQQNVAPASPVKSDLHKLDNFTNAKPVMKNNSDSGSSAINSKNVFGNEIANIFDISRSKNNTDQRSNTANNVGWSKTDKLSGTEKTNFKFSAPLAIVSINTDSLAHTTTVNKYTFSPPDVVHFETSDTEALSSIRSKVQDSVTPPPQLKSGSVLDALKPITLSTTKDISSAGDTAVKIGFGDQFKKSAGNKWECDTCLIRNDSTIDKCVACETPRTTSKPPLVAGASTFGAQFKKSSDQWECEVCMVRNKEQDYKCSACESPRKGIPNSTERLSNLNPSSSCKSNSFGDMFKPKPNSWECPTCLISNKSDCSECIACQTRNPSSNSGNSSNPLSDSNTKGTTFKFGFGTLEQSTKPAPPDSGFKTLAASQMSAKWECDACMTRNDAARNKCVCCEQAKPGTATTDAPTNGPKFTFGSTATTKFTFGFGSNANGASTESNVATTSLAISNQKTDGGSTKGFVFGNTNTATSTSGGSGFTFGVQTESTGAIKENTNTNTNISKDVTDKGNIFEVAKTEEKSSGFKFGTDISSAKKDVVSTSSATTLSFGVTSSIVTKSKPATTSPVVKFNLSAPTTNSASMNNTSSIRSDSTAAPSSKTTTGGFTFGNSIMNATSQLSKSELSIGTPAKSTMGEKSSTQLATATFSFGSTVPTQANQVATTSSTTATSTATVKPMFSFGSNVTSTTTAVSSGGFSFGSSISGATTVSPTAKSLFGNITAPNKLSVAPAVSSVPATTTISTLSATSANVFGTFGDNVSSAKTTTTSATPVLASTTLPPTTTNIFGVPPAGSADSKPTGSATMIFGSASNIITGSNKPANSVQSAPFVFGSSPSNVNTQEVASNASTTSSGLVAPATNWPKGGFAFGTSTGNSGTSNINESSTPVFGSFMNAAAPNAAAASTTTSALGSGTSVFGSSGANNTVSGVSATFGSVAANASTTSSATIFGTAGVSSAATPSTPNLFGSVAAIPSTFGVTPSFGSNSNNLANNAAGFGNASTATFGSFGSTSSTASTDGASAPKKSEPAFNFGGSTSQIGSSGGFNFGAQASVATKPAFNFSASSVPTFNFTGSSGDAAKPFQFGATPSAPVFNFSGGVVEPTPNAPFQFNAGSAPASSNIFAPTPAAANAQGAMPARRKIRQPTRRLTPR